MKAELLTALQRTPIEGHTPGPWFLIDSRPEYPERWVSTAESDGLFVAVATNTPEGLIDCELIANAPDLQSENAVLREAVQELAWGLRFFWHKNEDEVKERWEEAYSLAHAIVEAKEKDDV